MRDLLQAFGVARHYQTGKGTLIAQDDKDAWTLQTRPPLVSILPRSIPMPCSMPGRGGPSSAKFWLPIRVTHLLLAERYGAGRVFLAGDELGASSTSRPAATAWTRALAMPSIWDGSSRRRWGYAGPDLLASYEEERRPVGLRNRLASERHTGVRIKIAELYESERDPDALGRAPSPPWAMPRTSWGIEFGYRYDGIDGDPVTYQPTTAPGARLPSTFLRDGSALYDHLGPWFTLLRFGDADPSPLIVSAPVPLETVIVDDASLASVYEAKLVW